MHTCTLLNCLFCAWSMSLSHAKERADFLSHWHDLIMEQKTDLAKVICLEVVSWNLTAKTKVENYISYQICYIAFTLGKAIFWGTGWDCLWSLLSQVVCGGSKEGWWRYYFFSCEKQENPGHQTTHWCVCPYHSVEPPCCHGFEEGICCTGSWLHCCGEAFRRNTFLCPCSCRSRLLLSAVLLQILIISFCV